MLFFGSSGSTVISQFKSVSLLGIGDTPQEQDAATFIVSDHEDERMIGTKHGNGWWAMKHCTSQSIVTAVAAAASVPSSLTSTKALWITSEMQSGSTMQAPGSVMPKKFADPMSNAVAIPIDLSTSASANCSVRRNFGKNTFTDCGASAEIHLFRLLTDSARFQLGQSADTIGQQHDHRQVSVPIRQLKNLNAIRPLHTRSRPAGASSAP